MLANGLSDERLHFAALLDAEKAQALPEFARDSGCELHERLGCERVAALVFLRPFRCRKCERRFLVYRPPSTLLG